MDGNVRMFAEGYGLEALAFENIERCVLHNTHCVLEQSDHNLGTLYTLWRSPGSRRSRDEYG